MKQLLVALLVLIPLLVQALTLDEALDIALKNNRTLKQQWEEKKAIDEEYNNVLGSFFPQVTLSGGYQLEQMRYPDSALEGGPSASSQISDSLNTNHAEPNNDDTLIENDQAVAGYLDNFMAGMRPDKTEKTASLYAGVKMDQVVFMGGKLINGLKVAKKAKSVQEKQYFLTKQDVIYNIIQMYYGAVLARDLLDIQNQALELAQMHQQQVNKMFENGLVSEYDKLRADLEVSRLEPDVVEAESRYKLALEALKKELDIHEEITLDDEIVEPSIESPDLKQAIAEGLSSRIEMELSNIGVDIQKTIYTTEKGNFLPNIGISAEYKYFGSGEDYRIESDDFGNSWSVGIGFSMPLFTGLSNTAKIKRARHNYQKSVIGHEELKSNIELQIRNTYYDLTRSIEKLESQQKNVELAEKGERIAEARYQNQVGTQLEVFDAQLQLRSIRLTYLNAVYDVIMSHEAFKKALGREL